MQETALEAVACLRNLAFKPPGAVVILRNSVCSVDSRGSRRNEMKAAPGVKQGLIHPVIGVLEKLLNACGGHAGDVLHQNDSQVVEYGCRTQFEALNL